MISRRWKKRKHVQNLALLICDEAHLVGGEIGPTYEVIISRTRYVSAQLTEQARERAEKQGMKLTKEQEKGPTRIVALGVSLANARDFGEWMGAPAHAVYNFAPSARPLDLDIHLQSFSIPHFPSLMIAMSKPAYVAIKDYSPTKPVIIFAPSRRQCRLTANDILSHCLADDNQDQFLNYDPEQLKEHLNHVDDQELVETLSHGIGFYHEALSKQDKKIVERLFEAGAIQVLIASRVSSCLPLSLCIS
jgi:pre-mRNA-splicing helicase BRR2